MLYFFLSYTLSHYNKVPADKIVKPILNTSAKHGFMPAGYDALCTASFANY